MVLDKNIMYTGYVVLSIIIVILIYLLINCKKNEKFCSCRQMTNKICPDPKVLTSLYESGELTENTDLTKFGKPVWKTVMPDDEWFDQQNNIPYRF